MSAHSLAPSVFGNYELLAPLGRGGMAEVFRARVRSGPREGWMVALKRLLPEQLRDPSAIALFAAEAELTRGLSHPNIVQVLDVGVLEGLPFLVMELVDGRDLAHILKRCKRRGIPLPVDFAVFLAKTLLEALDYAHNALGPEGQPLGIVHCDVSPSNLFISRVGETKLGDFGVARARAGASAEQSELLGKPYYLSPEALQGQVSSAVDLWAANVVLYELLTLEKPFVGSNPDEVYAAIRSGRYRSLEEARPELPENLRALVRRGFASSADERFKSSSEFAQALAPHYDERVGTPLAIAAVVRGLFGASEGD